MRAAEALATLTDLEGKHAAGTDVASELEELERALAAADQAEPGDGELASRVRAELAAGPIAVPAGCPPALAAALATLDRRVIGAESERALADALRPLAARADEARRRELHARVLERLGTLLEALGGGA